MAVAVDQHHGLKSFARPPRCRLQSHSQLHHKNMPEFNQTNLAHSLNQAFQVANIHRSFSTPCLPLSTGLEEELDANSTHRVEIIGGHRDPRARALAVEVAIALASGITPEPVSTGLSGTYFIRGRSNSRIAVVKPVDEEPLAFNNPKGFAGQMLGQPGMKHSIRVGETGLRELAAYLLDHGGFAGVPPTALVKISHGAFHINNSDAFSCTPACKIASLQQFVSCDFDAGDLGPSSFSVSSIHCIGILDVRLLNLDRHAGNMLVKNGHHGSIVNAAKLVPIDHGLCLPESLDDPYFEWLHWPQASVPFSESEVEYILKLDPFEDAQLLRKQLPSIRESAIRVLVLCTIFLKRAVAAGLCLADIGDMMTREFDGGGESLSTLEQLCLHAKAIMNSTQYHGSDNDHQHEDNVGEISCGQALEPSKPIQDPLLTGKAPRIKGFSSLRSICGLLDATLCPLYEEDVYDSCSEDWGIDIIKDDGNDNLSDRRICNGNGGKRGLTRSISFSMSNQNHQNCGISFGEIDEEEWKLFLENFEKLLPKVFEGRKSMGMLKQSSRTTSCEF
ncbi:1-phosphatidylinositol 4-kinase [Bertholletia excelsa]